jgi:hypothetical protein
MNPDNNSLSAWHRLGQLLLAFSPFIVFVSLYSLMNLYPNYEMNPVSTTESYEWEMAWFGLLDDGVRVIPSVYCQAHHVAWMDILSGVFYLLWVPLPVVFGLYLFFSRSAVASFRFFMGFLIVNLVGFFGYYLYPSAPPWYIVQYGFDVNVETPGHVAGFAHFDALLHTRIFHLIYEKNANVFAAIPSLHAAYNPVALYYAWRYRRKSWAVALAVVSIGIWVSAVYSAHHYVVDVLLGVLTTVVGLLLWEGVLLPALRRFRK